MYVEADPPSEKPALLMVHGLLSSRNHWLPNLGLRDMFRLIRVDLPGHGLSPPAPPEQLHPDALADALDRLRSDLGIQRWVVCGQSFGAGITLRLALRYPDQTLAHVFTNATVAVSDMTASEVLAPFTPRIERLHSEGDAALKAERIHPARAQRFPVALKALLTQDAAGMQAQAYLNLILHGLAHLPLGPHLADIRPPGLLVNGVWERRFQPFRTQLQDRMPGLVVRDLPGGHSINIEAAKAFDAAVTGFARDLGLVPPVRGIAGPAQ